MKTAMMNNFSKFSILWITLFLIVKCHGMDNEDVIKDNKDVIMDDGDVNMDDPDLPEGNIGWSDGIEWSEEQIRELMGKKVTIKGSSRTVTLGDIYKITPPIEDFDGVDKFLDLLQNHESTAPVELDIYAREPVTDAFVVPLHNIDYSSSDVHEGSLISIIGEPRTGKTTTLRGFERHLRKTFPSDIIIYLDAKKDLVGSELFKAREMSTTSLIGETIKDTFYNFVQNVAELNPTKIRVLIDSVDETPNARENTEKLIQLISVLHSDDIQVITSSCFDLSPQLNTYGIRPTQVFTIPSDVPISDLKEFTIKLWKRQASQENRGRINEVHMRDYFEILQMAIRDTPLPRTIGMMELIASAVSSHNYRRPFKSVFEYAETTEISDTMKREMLDQMLNNMPAQKMDLYTDYLYEYSGKRNIYGVMALKFMSRQRNFVQPFVDAINQKLNEYEESELPLLRFERGVPVGFIHPEIQYYYVADFLTSPKHDWSSIIILFNELYVKPRYRPVLEFINSSPYLGVDRNMAHVIGWISDKQNLVKEVMDNLLQNRFDNILSRFLDALDIEVIREYLSDQTVILQTGEKYSFGMQTVSVNDQLLNTLTHIPRKSPLTFQGVREDMIINLQMPETEKILRAKKYAFNPDLLLRYHAKHSPASRLISFFNEHVEHKFSVDVLNQALFESVDTLGIESLPIVKVLVGQGATPETIRMSGRTLAHVAAQWASPELMETLHKRYGVSLVDQLDDSGRSILFTALDANPFNTYIRPGFLEMMEYLVTRGDLRLNRNFILNELNKPILGATDLPPPFLTLLGDATVPQLENALNELRVYHAINEMDVPADVLATRRRAIIQVCFGDFQDQLKANGIPHWPDANREITVSEVLLRYRGSAPMDWKQKDGFENIATQMIWKEAENFNDLQKERVFVAFARTVDNDERLQDIPGSVYRRLIETHWMPGNNLDLSYVLGIFAEYIEEKRQLLNDPNHPVRLIRLIGTFNQLVSASRKDLRLTATWFLNAQRSIQGDEACNYLQ